MLGAFIEPQSIEVKLRFATIRASLGYCRFAIKKKKHTIATGTRNTRLIVQKISSGLFFYLYYSTLIFKVRNGVESSFILSAVE